MGGQTLLKPSAEHDESAEGSPAEQDKNADFVSRAQTFRRTLHLAASDGFFDGTLQLSHRPGLRRIKLLAEDDVQLMNRHRELGKDVRRASVNLGRMNPPRRSPKAGAQCDMFIRVAQPAEQAHHFFRPSLRTGCDCPCPLFGHGS